MSGTRAVVSVLLICEQAEQLTGSGCCGKLAGEATHWGTSDPFLEVAAKKQQFGLLHRAVRQFFPSRGTSAPVSLAQVDPRNQLYLVPKLWYDVCAYRPGWRDGLRTIGQWFSLPAVIVNGRILSDRGKPLDPDALCHAIQRILNADSRRGLHEHLPRIVEKSCEFGEQRKET